jgi:hypothetical protein
MVLNEPRTHQTLHGNLYREPYDRRVSQWSQPATAPINYPYDTVNINRPINNKVVRRYKGRTAEIAGMVGLSGSLALSLIKNVPSRILALNSLLWGSAGYLTGRIIESIT